jgi:hypothetical protein
MARVGALSIGLCVLLSGCIPFVTFVDYIPEMSAGIVSTDDCLGQHRLRFDIDGIAMNATIDRHPSGKQYAFRLSMSLVAGQVVEFTAPTALWTSSAGGRAERLGISDIMWFDGADFRPTARHAQDVQNLKLVGANVELRGRSVAKFFAVMFWLPDRANDKFALTLPDLVVNGKRVTLPPIRYERTPRVRVAAPLNC